MADGKELNENLGNAKENLQGINIEAAELRNVFAEIVQAIKESGKSAGDLAAANQNAIRDASKFRVLAEKQGDYNTKNLKDQRVVNGLKNKYAETQALVARNNAEIAFLEERIKNATADEEKQLRKILEVRTREVEAGEQLEKQYEKMVERAEAIQKAGSGFEKMANTLKSIPVIGPILASSLQKSADKVRQMEDDSTEFQKNMVRTSETLKGLGGGALTFLVASLFKADSSTTKLAKQLAISKDEARELRGAFNQIAIDSGTSALNAENLTEAFMQLGDSLGAVRGFNAERIEQQGRLVNLLGLEASEAANIASFGILNDKTTRSQTEGIVEQVELLKAETGIQLDNLKILSQVSQISGQLSAQYGYNTSELARAVVQANRLGLSLEDTQGIAGNLLDFESSIVNELNAELLLNKDLNLERARLLALNGKSAEAAAELAKQFGSAEEFSSLNVIQQQSLADAVGMSVDQLADSIRKQEVLQKLGVQNTKQLEEQGRLDELRTVRGGDQILQQLEQQSAAEKFQQAIIKIQAAVGALAEGPLGSLVDKLASAADSALLVKGAMFALGGLSLVKLVSTLVSIAASLGVSAAGSIATASALTLGIGAVAVIGGIVAMMAALNSQAETAKSLGKVDDMIMPAGYGDRIISTPKGSVALNNNDTIVAGTNLGQGSQETKRTNMLLEKLITQNDKKPQLSPVGLYEVQ